MTDEQLEIAAREYCRLVGLDPDANGIVCDERVHSPIWRRMTREIKDHWMIQEAIRAGWRSPYSDIENGDER